MAGSPPRVGAIIRLYGEDAVMLILAGSGRLTAILKESELPGIISVSGLPGAINWMNYE